MLGTLLHAHDWLLQYAQQLQYEWLGCDSQNC